MVTMGTAVTSYMQNIYTRHVAFSKTQVLFAFQQATIVQKFLPEW